MKIVKLEAENVKRLSAVEITPDGSTVVIAGRNGQGKTSVLDSIWYALGGGPAARGTTRPIRDGQDHAEVRLDLGELVVTRTWTAGGKSTLRVENADGATYRSPQAMLDGLVGRLSFDPLAFAQQDDRAQLASLLELVTLPFDPVELAGRRQTLYEDRTQVGRERKQLEGQLAGMPKPAADLPAEEVNVARLLADHRAARAAIEDRDSTQRRIDHLAASILRTDKFIEQLENQVSEQRKLLALEERSLNDEQAKLEAATAALPDVEGIERQLSEAEDVNRAVRAAAERENVAGRLANVKLAYDGLSVSIAELDTLKTDAIAEAEMPIDGLAFDDSGVTYRGVPFKQCSAAEQLRVSMAMALAMNPKLRVVLIRDASLLDSGNMALIEEMAVDRDAQVWLERVDESGDVGVVIEDGAVRPRADAVR